MTESSPLARALHLRRAERASAGGVIPARAGSTLCDLVIVAWSACNALSCRNGAGVPPTHSRFRGRQVRLRLGGPYGVRSSPLPLGLGPERHMRASEDAVLEGTCIRSHSSPGRCRQVATSEPQWKESPPLTRSNRMCQLP